MYVWSCVLVSDLYRWNCSRLCICDFNRCRYWLGALVGAVFCCVCRCGYVCDGGHVVSDEGSLGSVTSFSVIKVSSIPLGRFSGMLAILMSPLSWVGRRGDDPIFSVPVVRSLTPSLQCPLVEGLFVRGMGSMCVCSLCASGCVMYVSASFCV